jgi:hypothetical protein
MEGGRVAQPRSQRRPRIAKEVIDRIHVAEAVAKWDALGNSDRAQLKRWRFVADELGISPHGRKAEIEEAIGAALLAAAAAAPAAAAPAAAAPAAAAAARAAAAAAGGGGGSRARGGGSRGGSFVGMEVIVVCPSCKNPTSSLGGRVMLCDDCSRRSGSPSKSPSPRRCVPSSHFPLPSLRHLPLFLPPSSAPNPLAPDRRAPSASSRAVSRRAVEAVRPFGGIAALRDERGSLHVAVEGGEATGAAARAVMGLAMLLGAAPAAAVIAFASLGAGAAAPPPPSTGFGASTAPPPPASPAAPPYDAALTSAPSPAPALSPASAEGAPAQAAPHSALGLGQVAPLLALSAPALLEAALTAAQVQPAPHSALGQSEQVAQVAPPLALGASAPLPAAPTVAQIQPLSVPTPGYMASTMSSIARNR